MGLHLHLRICAVETWVVASDEIAHAWAVLTFCPLAHELLHPGVAMPAVAPGTKKHPSGTPE